MQELVSPKRWIRKCRAAAYFDMGETLFNKTIKPLLPEPYKVGEAGLFYERVDLDRAADKYISRSGQSRANTLEQRQCKTTQDCQNEEEAPITRSIKQSGTGDRKLSYGKQRAHLSDI
jgi:hypothetical protein